MYYFLFIIIPFKLFILNVKHIIFNNFMLYGDSCNTICHAYVIKIAIAKPKAGKELNIRNINWRVLVMHGSLLLHLTIDLINYFHCYKG